MVGFLLDAKIRKLTEGKKSLDSVMTEGMKRYAGERGFTPQQFRQLASEMAGADLGDFFTQALERAEELDYREALEYFGLRWKAAPKPETGKPPVFTGITTKTENGRLLVASVRRDSPAWRAGVNANDEILAIGDYRVRPEQWSARLDFYKDAASMQLLLSRRDRLMTLELPVALEVPQSWQLEVRPDATAEQKARFAAWTQAQ